MYLVSNFLLRILFERQCLNLGIKSLKIVQVASSNCVSLCRTSCSILCAYIYPIVETEYNVLRQQNAKLNRDQNDGYSGIAGRVRAYVTQALCIYQSTEA